MIVQTAPEPHERFVIRNVDHAKMATSFASAFGNDKFRRIEPWDLMLFLVENHEEGWRFYDERPRLDPGTGFPFHLAETPQSILVQKSRLSPDFNERHHPWCGLLSSMHSWGLYNHRYGLSDKVSIEKVLSEEQEEVNWMLDAELARQERLKGNLARQAESASWIEPVRLFSSYKLLEFFDTLALYLQLTHWKLRKPSAFQNVPMDVGQDCTVFAEPIDVEVVRLQPYPFGDDPLQIECSGKCIGPCASDDQLTAALERQPFDDQHYLVVS
jgi:Protein of unknown function (DUF3891)